MRSVFEVWQVTPEELSQAIIENPSLRGMVFGYLAEVKTKNAWFQPPRVGSSFKPDDHKRSEKCDLIVSYKGHEFKVEIKSLQTNSVKDGPAPWEKSGWYQCDASDCRDVILPNRRKVKTTCLLIDEFDIVAVNLFAFFGRWEFAFARNKDLPRSSHKGYSKAVQKYLLATAPRITWPLQSPYRSEPYSLFDEIIAERRLSQTL